MPSHRHIGCCCHAGFCWLEWSLLCEARLPSFSLLGIPPAVFLQALSLVCVKADVTKCHHLCTVASSRVGLFSVTACLLGHPIFLDRVITLLHPLPSCTFSFFRRPTRKTSLFFHPYTLQHMDQSPSWRAGAWGCVPNLLHWKGLQGRAGALHLSLAVPPQALTSTHLPVMFL